MRRLNNDDIDALIGIIHNTFWMARRYANGRQTYAPNIINDCLEKLHTLGIDIDPDEALIHDGNSSANTLDIN